MNIGILGGTFDPIHWGHLQIAQAVYHSLNLNIVLFVPAGNPPHKADVVKTSTHHRQNMVALAIAQQPHFQLSRVDIDRPGPHYSVDTVQFIRAQYNLPADACFFIIGGDSLVDLPTWYQADKLINLCRLAVIHRPGYRPDTKTITAHLPNLEARLVWVAAPAINISASAIRACFAAGHTSCRHVPDKVNAYIMQHQLYHP